MKPVYLLTGKPGMGKTSLIKQVVAGFQLKAGGFYTEEIRKSGIRLGFKLVTLDGHEAILAHADFNKRFRVGKYGVDVESLNRVGVSALREASEQCDLIVVDEIGKMELFSPGFREAILEIIDSGKRVLGTIMLGPNPWADAIKLKPQVKVIEVTRANHHRVFEELIHWLEVSSKNEEQS